MHCGQLNQGHMKLIQKGWNIIPIKSLTSYNLSAVDLVVVDEAQRIYARQLEQLVTDANNHNISCIFSYDKQQTLSSRERLADIETKINGINGIVKF